MTSSQWKIQGMTATWQQGDEQLLVKLDMATLCVQKKSPQQVFETVAEHRVMLLEIPGETGFDFYVRGNDLVATFAPTATRPTRVQIYWRVWGADMLPKHSSAELPLVWELILSVQTPLLESDPTLTVEINYLEAAEVNLTDHLLQVEQANQTLAQLIHPHDRYQQVVLWQPPQEIDRLQQLQSDVELPMQVLNVRTLLFGDNLEKGVILRARALNVILPAGQSAADLQEHYAAAEPILTT